jgi:hypothetical protein
MLNKVALRWLSKGALVLLLLYGSLCTLIGAAGLFVPFILGHRGPVILWRYILLGPIAALAGAGTLMRLRLAAVLVALFFALAGADEMYGIAHGFGLPNPPHISNTEIVCVLVFTVLPLVLVVLAWGQLRWSPRGSHQAP